MNQTIKELFDRKSVRSFQDREIPSDIKDLLLDASIQAPTAGNQVLYTILDIQDQQLKDRLAVLCDNQPFIAKAPLVLVFLADCRRWQDSYKAAGCSPRRPGAGDILLACEDALIAAQNSVVAAESLGIGSCYIGDILENREELTGLLNLDPLVLPITMLVYGYPTEQQMKRAKPRRFDREYIVQKDRYRPLPEADLREMFKKQQDNPDLDFDDYVSRFCERKYQSDFARELNRSSGDYLRGFMGLEEGERE